MISAAAAVDRYAVRPVLLAEAPPALFAAWRACAASHRFDTAHFGDPEWLIEVFRGEAVELRAFVLERGTEVAGVAPFALGRLALPVTVGDVTLGTVPLRRLRLLGGCPPLPPDSRVYDAVFGAIVAQAPDYDAVYMEGLRVDSFLWQYLHSSPLIARAFHLSCARGPVPRPFVRFQGTFDDYMSKFSSKTRETWRRKRKRLNQRGAIELLSVGAPDQVDAFVDRAIEISRTTYQFNRLGLGLRDREAWKRRLGFAAERGWLRSYLLTCGGTPCCFMVGYQYQDRFYYAEVGYDPAWRDFSVGAILLLSVLEDLFSRDTPEMIDFGAGGEYKKHFENDSYLEADVFLFRRRPYPLTVAAMQRACRLTSRVAATVLDRLRVKHLIKRRIGTVQRGGTDRGMDP